MVVNTLIEILDQAGNIICRYKTNTFTKTTRRKDIINYILSKCNEYKLPFAIEILDQHDGYVTLDDDFLEEYNPFAPNLMAATTVQTITSSEPSVTLRISTFSDYNLASTLGQPYATVLNEILQTIDQQHEPPQGVALAESTEKSSNPVTVRLSEDTKMGFVTGHNVNNKQRDQYICDQVNINTGENTGTLTMIQGQKNGKNKYKTVLPRYRIWNDKIQNRIEHVWTLLVYLVLDVSQSGKRSLLYHPQRTLVTKNNLTQSLNPYEIPITTDDWMEDTGLKLELTTVVIEGAKKHHTLSSIILCHLDNIDGSESSPNYCKSRFAFVLRKDDDILWETLVLSNEMVFGKNADTAQVINLLTPPKNTSLKRSRSNKCQNSAKKRSKTQVTNNQSVTKQQLTDSSDNNDFSILPNQQLPVHYNTSQTTAATPRTTSDISAAGSHLILNSTETETFYEDTTAFNNLLSNHDDFFNNVNAITSNNDPFFNSTDFFDDDDTSN